MTLTVPLVIGFSFTLLVLSYYLQREARKRQQDIVQNTLATSEELVCCEAERFFNLSLDLLAIANTDGYFIRLNPAWQTKLGFTLEELKAQPFIELVHPEDQEATQTEMVKLKAGIPLNRLENRYRCKDGSYKWLSWTAVPFLAEGLIYGVACDISNLKHVEEALRQSEERFRIALKNSPIIVFNQDNDLHYTWVYNPLSGYEVKDIVGKLDAELFSEEDAQRLTALKQRVLATGIGTREETYLTSNGEVRYYDLTVEPLRNLNGEIIGITCATTDITECKQTEAALQRANEMLESRIAERTAHLSQVNDELVAEIVNHRQVEIALRKSEQQYRTLIETIPHGIVEIDTTGIITFSNWAYQRLLGYTDGDLLGKSISDLTVESERSKVLDYIARKVQEQPSPTPYISQFLTKEGKLIDVQADWSYKRHEQGRVIGFISVVTDITERKQLEVELAASEERFRTSIETMLDCFGMYWAIRDESGQIVDFLIGYVNEAACVNNRMTKEEQIGQRLCELFPAHCEIGLFDEYVKLVETGQPLVKESLYYEDTSQGQRLSRSFDIRAVKLGDGFAAAWRDITERKQAEDALRVSEERLRTALEAAHMGTWDWNIVTGQVTWSDNFQRFLGITSDRLDGKYQSFIDIIHPEDRDRVLQKLEKILQEGKDYEDEFRIVLPDGNIRWLASQGQVFYDETGKPVRITGIALDITQRKQAEEEQRKTEQLYRTLASNFPNGVVSLFDKDLRYTLTEGKGLAEVGLSKEFLEGKTVAQIFPPDVCEIKERAYRTALDGTPTVCEIPFGDLHYLMHTLPLRNEQGEIYAGMSMSQDISDRKRAELALLEERNFVSAILDTAGALITVYDRQWKFIRVNRACEQITGYSFDEVKDKCVWDLFLIPEEIESVKAVFQELQAGQFPIEHENYWVIRDGSRRLISWSNTAILDAEGSVKYIISIGVDITDRKRAEEIRRALEQAQELSDLRLRFFSMVSHEFRTPLSTILVSAQTLESRAHEWPEDKRRKSLRRIESAAKHLTQLLDDVLTINRAETGKLDLNPKAINLEKFCCSLLEELQLQAGNKHRINLVNQGNCKNVFLDERLLRSILSNLLSNAIKYSPQGGEIQWVVNCEPGKVIFNIRDQGIGIPFSDQARIFEPFHRGNNVGTIPGTGLGITVVKKCLDLQGGNISINSEEGSGTTVIVTIPERF